MIKKVVKERKIPDRMKKCSSQVYIGVGILPKRKHFRINDQRSSPI